MQYKSTCIRYRINMYTVQDLHVCLCTRQVSDEQCVVLYSGTSLKGHLWNKDTSLIRALDWAPTLHKYMLFSPWNKDTSLISTIILVPRVSILEGFHCTVKALFCKVILCDSIERVLNEMIVESQDFGWIFALSWWTVKHCYVKSLSKQWNMQLSTCCT